MKRNIVSTADGSHSLRLEDWEEQYHSKHGAITESHHVFIKNGLEVIGKDRVSILEMGFGTGLNAFLSLVHSTVNNMEIHYTGIEAFPLSFQEWNDLNYVEKLNAADFKKMFEQIHSCPWEEEVAVATNFHLTKLNTDMLHFRKTGVFDLVYFDAFGYRVQPELWSKEVFANMYASMKPGGKLVTYAAKGIIRRTMEAVGFQVERLQGPPGKREMLRATKMVI